MFGFGKKARKAVSDIKKFEKRDLAQAVVNAAYLVAYADGECEASEKAKIEQVLRNQPSLAAFTSEINAISATIVGQLDTNFKIGRRAALREIEDVKHDTGMGGTRTPTTLTPWPPISAPKQKRLFCLSSRRPPRPAKKAKLSTEP